MEHQRKLFQQRGYSEDLLPKTQSQRTWKTFNYFTLWMGSVHNVPNYVMVGGFFILGLSTFSIMLAIILSAFFIAAVMVLNGAAGSKYGVPFAMILRASYGVRGALFPGLLRGGIAAIMWFGLQCYAGSLACLILIGKIWPGKDAGLTGYPAAAPPTAAPAYGRPAVLPYHRAPATLTHCGCTPPPPAAAAQSECSARRCR